MLQISLPRGDIRNIKFKVTSGETAYTDFTEIYFTVKRDYNASNFLFQKKLSDGTISLDGEGFYNLTLESEDTEGLEYKKYVFDIEVVKGDVIK